MLSLSQLQSFIGEVSNMVNSKDNPLGLSPGQVDEINQIMNIIKNLISDGIQRGDISKLVHLMGEMAEHMPELQGDIKEIITDLKELGKKLFKDDDKNNLNNAMKFNNPVKKPAIETDLLMGQEIGERGVVSEGVLDEELNDDLLKDSFNDRATIAEKILNMINNHMVLKTENFDAIEGLLKKINRRAGLGPVGGKQSSFGSEASEKTFSDQRVNKVNPLTQSNESDAAKMNPFGSDNSTFSAGA